MRLKKPIKQLKIAVLVPSFKRPEYTYHCIKALNETEQPCEIHYFLVDDASEDGTDKVLEMLKHENRTIVVNKENEGLRAIIIKFFRAIKGLEFDIIAKVDNDCWVPKDYFTKMLDRFVHTEAEILSPNVLPSNAAMELGEDDLEDKGFRPSKYVGGIWMMYTDLLDKIIFEDLDVNGFLGAFPIIKQIITIKRPVVGWAHEVEVQDVGHWSGEHVNHIKSDEHRFYTIAVGREVSW